MPQAANPFHAGERRAQARAGFPDVAEWAAGYIRPAMPDQHRTFFSQLPFLVLAGADKQGKHWVTLLDGEEGFVTSPSETLLTIDAAPHPQDPLAASFAEGTDIGMLGIELATRRRNRLNGTVRANGTGYAIDVRQSFGNCPQYIQERDWRRVPKDDEPIAAHSKALTDGQIARIRAADTLFIGTGQMGCGDHASNGFDASHRGGAPGFVEVVDAGRLRIPDYAGNTFFNTIGNLLENPAIGLVFVDFETGGLLHLSGRARIEWDGAKSQDPKALRVIDVTIEAVVERPSALSLRWARTDDDLRALVVTDKVVESETITSFYLAPADGKPLASFKAGQHLPIDLDIPGQQGRTKRSYSLSGAPGSDRYRISVKREALGVASRFLHDAVDIGDSIAARAPSGDFLAPCTDCPLVLVSAGVGLTPMLSMLHAAIAEESNRPLWWVHGARNGAQHAFKGEVEALVGSRSHVKKHICYSQPAQGDRPGVEFDVPGRIDAQKLLDLNAGPSAHYLLCGPATWAATLRMGLEARGIHSDQIHFETFGPTT
ncbi:MAG: pyridoxamine 5'-phosphate oxidase family protein [Pseudomonadota bacterium]